MLVVPAAHVWLLAAGRSGRGPAIAMIATAVAACIPAVAALTSVAASLDLGAAAPWTLALMVADGQIGLGVVVPLCFLGGALLAGSALALHRARLGQAGSPGPKLVSSPREPLGDSARYSNER